MEYVEGVDYVKLGHFLNTMQSSQNPITSNLGKCELHQLLSLAQSDREQELIRCTALKASGYSITAAKKVYGFQDVNKRLEQSIFYTSCAVYFQLC